MFELDPRIGPQPFRSGDDRLRLTHNEMFEQGMDIEYRKQLVEEGKEDKIRYEEIKAAYGCRGLCDAIRLLPWLDYTTFFAFPICHNLLLGLHGQIPGNIRDVVGERIFDSAVRVSDKNLAFVRRPTEIKRPTKRFLPAGSSNLFSGFKIEDHLHGMETFEPLVFYDIFDKFPNGVRLKVLYFRFVSAAMYLLRGAFKIQCCRDAVSKDDIDMKDKLEDIIHTILRLRRECIANIKCCCILIQLILPVSTLSPNLHAWRCMITHLMDLCGHPKFEICIERLLSINTF